MKSITCPAYGNQYSAFLHLRPPESAKCNPIILHLTVCHSAMGLIVILNYKLLYINTGMLMKW
ncbi:hypothetical protein RUMGNA_02131 [Mediterraneibacter gnavus ATCC 29149]|uniref:Uncharacterized protein n=1 Tax=Mediterraneibacter gnavus (strain ATCC 29149 / DSM 114966 / JCM 6515 / VPI C7-9) TaxID=411470 RepID=A7B3K0_MEDG7|nr:hypothetical protein RUMGNA_02131 [Mediterraneibacter gnavus ATCC 29149]